MTYRFPKIGEKLINLRQGSFSAPVLTYIRRGDYQPDIDSFRTEDNWRHCSIDYGKRWIYDSPLARLLLGVE